MKHQALFPKQDKSKKIKYRLQQFLLGPLRVKSIISQDVDALSMSNKSPIECNVTPTLKQEHCKWGNILQALQVGKNYCNTPSVSVGVGLDISISKMLKFYVKVCMCVCSPILEKILIQIPYSPVKWRDNRAKVNKILVIFAILYKSLPSL